MPAIRPVFANPVTNILTRGRGGDTYYTDAVKILIYTLNTFGQVSEVEEVVGLGWSRQQVCAHSTIDLHTSNKNKPKHM